MKKNSIVHSHSYNCRNDKGKNNLSKMLQKMQKSYMYFHDKCCIFRSIRKMQWDFVPTLCN